MENLFNNSGLQHIAEEILLNLNSDDLEKCSQVNESWNFILKNPYFWLRKCIKIGRVKKSKSGWKEAIELMKNSNLKEKLTKILKKISTSVPLWNVPPIYWAAMVKDYEVVILLASSTENLNFQSSNGLTPIQMAAVKGHAIVIKLLAPFTNDPNAPSPKGWTPLFWAAKYGYLDVVEALVTELVKKGIKNINAPDDLGRTPLQYASLNNSILQGKMRRILSNPWAWYQCRFC